MKRRGFTLIESVIAASLFALIMGLVAALFVVGKKSQEATLSSYFLSREMENAVRWLRRDLQETCLGSISIDSTGGLALLSCRAYGNDSQKGMFGKLSISEHGVPQWEKVVLYHLVANPKNSETATLTRWEAPYAQGPIPGCNLTTDPKYAQKYRPADVDPKSSNQLLHDAIRPDIVLKDNSGKALSEPYTSDATGGFRVCFVQRDGAGNEAFSNINPANQTTTIGNNTRLVEVRLKTLRRNSSGQANFLYLKFRVCPRY